MLTMFKTLVLHEKDCFLIHIYIYTSYYAYDSCYSFLHLLASASPLFSGRPRFPSRVARLAGSPRGQEPLVWLVGLLAAKIARAACLTTGCPPPSRCRSRGSSRRARSRRARPRRPPGPCSCRPRRARPRRSPGPGSRRHSCTRRT